MGVSGSGAYSSFLRSSMFWHLLLIGAVSIWFESLFIHSGPNVMDEG